MSVQSTKRNPPRVPSSKRARRAEGSQHGAIYRQGNPQPLATSSPRQHNGSRLPGKGGRCSHQGEPSVGSLVQMDGEAWMDTLTPRKDVAGVGVNVRGKSAGDVRTFPRGNCRVRSRSPRDVSDKHDERLAAALEGLASPLKAQTRVGEPEPGKRVICVVGERPVAVLLNQHPYKRPLVYRKAVLSQSFSPRKGFSTGQRAGIRSSNTACVPVINGHRKEKRQSAPEYLASSPGKAGHGEQPHSPTTVGNGRVLSGVDLDSTEG